MEPLPFRRVALRRGALSLGLVAATALALATACGTETEGVDVYSASRFPSAYAQALCGSLQHCCDENKVQLRYAECTAGWKGYVEGLLRAPAALTNFDSRKAKECIDLIRTASGVSCDPVPGSISDARDTCLTIFAGKKPIGAPCATAAECAQKADGPRVGCEIPPDGTVDAGILPLSQAIEALAVRTPVCIELGTAGLGAPCLTTPQTGARGTCEAEAFCDPDTLKCAPLGEAGAKCIPGACVAGAACASGGPNQGKCVPSGPIGSPCTIAEDCDSTSRCDQNKCVSRMLAGEGCSSDADCAIGFCDRITKRCLKNAIATSNTCNGKSD